MACWVRGADCSRVLLSSVFPTRLFFSGWWCGENKLYSDMSQLFEHFVLEMVKVLTDRTRPARLECN